MDRPSLTKEYILNWLVGYSAKENTFITDYVIREHYQDYLHTLFLVQQQKPKDELIGIILEFTNSSQRTFLNDTLSHLNEKCLAAIIMTLNSTDVGGDQVFSDFVHGPWEDERSLINNIFLEYVSGLSLKQLKELLLQIIPAEADVVIWETKTYTDAQILKFLDKVNDVLEKKEVARRKKDEEED